MKQSFRWHSTGSRLQVRHFAPFMFSQFICCSSSVHVLFFVFDMISADNLVQREVTVNVPQESQSVTDESA